MNHNIQIKRVYDPSLKEDGYRILVDRLWPRGIKKENLEIDEWLKDLAPSTALRQWYAHIPERFDDFSKRYREELEEKKTTLQRIIDISKKQRVTLLYSAKDSDLNQARVIQDTLIGMNI